VITIVVNGGARAAVIRQLLGRIRSLCVVPLAQILQRTAYGKALFECAMFLLMSQVILAQCTNYNPFILDP
jgi:hypothetical protein